MQAKDISTLDSMRALSAGVVNLRQLEQAFPNVPRKVIHAKYRALFRNGLLDDGCDCGCSTHARITHKGRELIEEQCRPPHPDGVADARPHIPASVPPSQHE